jgi:hypothetical protein
MACNALKHNGLLALLSRKCPRDDPQKQLVLILKRPILVAKLLILLLLEKVLPKYMKKS